jgi:hypothetical protein
LTAITFGKNASRLLRAFYFMNGPAFFPVIVLYRSEIFSVVSLIALSIAVLTISYQD